MQNASLFHLFRFLRFSLIFPDENIILHHFFITPGDFLRVCGGFFIFQFCKDYFKMILVFCVNVVVFSGCVMCWHVIISVCRAKSDQVMVVFS